MVQGLQEVQKVQEVQVVQGLQEVQEVQVVRGLLGVGRVLGLREAVRGEGQASPKERRESRTEGSSRWGLEPEPGLRVPVRRVSPRRRGAGGEDCVAPEAAQGRASLGPPG